jgi:hypothetical protein
MTDQQDRIETRIQFRAGDRLFAFLAGRAVRMGTRSADIQARAEIETWRDVMAAELRTVLLTLAEARCLAGILKGHQPSTAPVNASIGRCYAEAAQAFRIAREAAASAPAGKWWSVDEDVLLGKLRRLGPAADLALEDAIAHWHASRLEATDEGFGEAGLRIIGPS